MISHASASLSRAAVVRRLFVLLLAAAALLGLAVPPAGAQDPAGDPAADELRDVDILPLEGFIDPPVANQVLELLDDAAERGSMLVVLQIDAEGVISADVDELVDRIRQSPVPVAVFVGPRSAQARAGGGAAALLYAAHVAAIAEDATVGPAAPLDLGDVMDDASLQAAVDLLGPLAHDRLEGLVVPGPDGDLVGEDALARLEVDALTLAEAGAVDLVVSGLEPLLAELDGRTVATVAGSSTLELVGEDVEIGVRLHSLSLGRRILHAATTPTLIYLLLVVGLGMLLFEWFQPGFGVAGFTALILLLLAVIGLTILPITWWALALVLLGMGLFAIDAAIAGFGPVTLAAAAALAFGSLNLYATEPLALSGGIVALMVASAIGFFVVVLTIILRAQAGPDDLAVEQLVGRPGIVRSVLSPEGHVYVDGALWRARWVGESKRAKVGTPVRVSGTDGATVLVEAFVARPGEAVPTGEVPDEALQTGD